MKPACPIENCPVKPLMRLSDTARTMLIPHSMMTRPTYGLANQGRTRLSAAITPATIASHRSWCIRAPSQEQVDDRPPVRTSYSGDGTLELLRRRLSEQAGGPHEQDQDEQHERDRVAPGRGQVTDHHHLGDAHDEPPEHGPGN